MEITIGQRHTGTEMVTKCGYLQSVILTETGILDWFSIEDEFRSERGRIMIPFAKHPKMFHKAEFECFLTHTDYTVNLA